MKITYLPFLILSLISFESRGQSATSAASALSVIPSSPNVAALGKYGDMPVGYFTGTPEINIPLYTIQLKHISQPVSLSYHGGGVKVEEIASSVGLGFSLNAGGMISRQVRGLPDEKTNGYIQNINTSYAAIPIINLINQDYSADPNALYDNKEQINLAQNQIDTEPDLFYFNFGNYSGKFFFDQASGKFVCISKKELQITYSLVNDQWIITTEDGTAYYFQVSELNNTSNQPCSTFSSSYKTAWFLTKIVSAAGVDEIDFTYQSNTYNYQTLSSNTVYEPLSGTPPGVSNPPPFGLCGYQSIVTDGIGGRRLTKITFPNGEMDFTYGLCRADVIGDQALTNIAIYQNGSLCKQYILNYDYFGNSNQTVNAASCQDNTTNRQNSVNYRLKLLSVATQGSDGVQLLPPYTFQYYTNSTLPNRLALDQDFMGYWNGPNGNTTLVPTFVYGSTVYAGGNRSPNPSYAQACILTGLTYPTGGATSFQWEGNQVPNNGTVSGQLQAQEVGVGISDLVLGQQITRTFQVNASPDPSNGYQNGAEVSYTYTFNGTCTSPTGSCVQIQVTDMSGNLIFTLAPGANVGPYYLPNGNYQLLVRTAANAQITSFSAILNWQALIVSQGNITTAGLRLQSMTDQNTDGTAYTKYFKYEANDNTHLSSGGVSVPPAYTYNISFNGGGYLVRNNYTNYPLAATQGSYVYYSRVTAIENNTQGTNGKTVYTYANTPDQLAVPGSYINGSSNAAILPFPPATSNDHLRGQLLDKTDFQYQNGTFTPVKETMFQYNTLLNLKTRGIKYMPYSWQTQAIGGNNGQVTLYSTQFYDTESDWVYLASTTDRMYDPANAGNYTDVVTNYTYDPNDLQTIQTNTFNSKGEQLITQLQYPGSYADADAGTVVADMKDNRFMQNAVIQKTTFKIDNQGNNILLASEINQYNYTPGTGINYVEPVEKDILATTQTIDPTNTTAFPPYKPANGYNTGLFEKRASYSYDANGNVMRQNLANGPYTAYQWGYNNQYPVAQATNASSNDIFYDSFEEGDGNSSAGDSKTGNYSHTGTYTKALSGLDAGSYILSYWQETSGVWSLQSSTVTVSGSTYTISLNAQVDDVRFYPALGQMTTYTYTPLVGMTSSTDAKDETTYYEYDAFQRLINIKDKDRNVTKHYTYHYQGQ